MKRLKLFFSWLYTLDHYYEKDSNGKWKRLPVWDYLYTKRIGIKRAWKIAKDLEEILSK